MGTGRIYVFKGNEYITSVTNKNMVNPTSQLRTTLSIPKSTSYKRNIFWYIVFVFIWSTKSSTARFLHHRFCLKNLKIFARLIFTTNDELEWFAITTMETISHACLFDWSWHQIYLTRNTQKTSMILLIVNKSFWSWWS